MLGVKTCRAARTCCAGRVHWRSASQSVRARAGPVVWHAGVGPLAACLAMAHVAVLSFDPNTRGRPSVTSYAYGLLSEGNTQHYYNQYCRYSMHEILVIV